ncbi:hypothetical protein V8E36_004718 [Tilletia maclaganii]
MAPSTQVPGVRSVPPSSDSTLIPSLACLIDADSSSPRPRPVLPSVPAHAPSPSPAWCSVRLRRLSLAAAPTVSSGHPHIEAANAPASARHSLRLPFMCSPPGLGPCSTIDSEHRMDLPLCAVFLILPALMHAAPATTALPPSSNPVPSPLAAYDAPSTPSAPPSSLLVATLAPTSSSPHLSLKLPAHACASRPRVTSTYTPSSHNPPGARLRNPEPLLPAHPTVLVPAPRRFRAACTHMSRS